MVVRDEPNLIGLAKDGVNLVEGTILDEKQTPTVGFFFYLKMAQLISIKGPLAHNNLVQGKSKTP